MKISKEQKAENRRKIIRAAVNLFTEKGVRSATMKAIARSAGVADATIYNYFPTKEAILFGFYQDHMQDVIERLKSIEDFNTYGFQEQLQILMETSLDLYLPDREFVAETHKTVFLSFSSFYRQLKPIRQSFYAVVREIYEAAIEVGEIPDQVFLEVSHQFFWDYYIAMVHYWLNDTSEQFADTTVLIDKSLDLACTMIKSGIANKIFDIMTFLFKQHVLSKMDLIREKIDTVHIVKRRFMEGFSNG